MKYTTGIKLNGKYSLYVTFSMLFDYFSGILITVGRVGNTIVSKISSKMFRPRWFLRYSSSKLVLTFSESFFLKSSYCASIRLLISSGLAFLTKKMKNCTWLLATLEKDSKTYQLAQDNCHHRRL